MLATVDVALDQPGPLQHAQVLRDRRQADLKRLGDLGHARIAPAESGEDRPGRVGSDSAAKVWSSASERAEECSTTWLNIVRGQRRTQAGPGGG